MKKLKLNAMLISTLSSCDSGHGFINHGHGGYIHGGLIQPAMHGDLAYASMAFSDDYLTEAYVTDGVGQWYGKTDLEIIYDDGGYSRGAPSRKAQ